MDEKCGYKTPTPADSLEQQIIDPSFPKNEREWWASEEITRLRAEVEDLTADRDSWIEQDSARTADAVQYLQERDAARAEAESLRADALKQVDCRQCKHATNRGCHSTALCERGELFEATPPWQFYDAARAAQGERG